MESELGPGFARERAGNSCESESVDSVLSTAPEPRPPRVFAWNNIGAGVRVSKWQRRRARLRKGFVDKEDVKKTLLEYRGFHQLGQTTFGDLGGWSWD